MKYLLKNYLKVSFRGLFDNKLFSFLNIFGLAVGIVVCLLLAQYVYFEYSYDRFHEQAESIYRVPLISQSESLLTATNHPMVGPTMTMDFPEVENFCRLVDPSVIFRTKNLGIKYIDTSGNIISFREEKMFIADSSIFTMFSFNLVKGNPSEALTGPNSIALSETKAEKYFGDEDPMGKTLYLWGQMPLQVTAIFTDIPNNSHIQFDILISYTTISPAWRPAAFDSWRWPEFYNYILLKPGANPREFEARFPSFVEKYLGETMREFNRQWSFSLQPLTDIHLKSDCLKEPQAQGNEKTVRFLSLLAIFVLIIAWINYVNLTTTRSLSRAREVGLRKVIGASRSNLVTQFLFDSLLLNILAAFLGSVILVLVYPYFNRLSGGHMSRNLLANELFQNPNFWWIAIVLLISGALLSGLYPSLRISSFQPAEVIKGHFFGSQKGIRLRKILVLFQFSITLTLIAATLLVRQQLEFMMNMDLGFRKDQMLIVRPPTIYDSTTWNHMEYFKSEIQRLPQVISTTYSSEIPGHRILYHNTSRMVYQEVEDEAEIKYYNVDHEFFKTFDIPLLAGRDFNVDDSTTFFKLEDNRIIVNRKTAELMGFSVPQEAIGQQMYIRTPLLRKAEIIGVAENYHQLSLKEDCDPILFTYPTWSDYSYYCFHVTTLNLSETLGAVRNLYNEALPGNTFDYFFLDEYFDWQYRSEQQFRGIVSVFSILAIVVACLGLYGLSLFMVNQRDREIGIRKIFGSSALQVLELLSKDFLILVLVSLLIGGPIIYWAGQTWLDNFSYRIDVNWSIFVVPVLILLVISLITTSFQTVKAAVKSPLKMLRHE